MITMQITLSMHGIRSHTFWMIWDFWKSECMTKECILSTWIQMGPSQNTESMDDKRSHTFYMNPNGEKSKYSVNGWYKNAYLLSEFKSEYCIKAWQKITYFLHEFKWLQVRVLHQCRMKEHIPPEYNSKYSINAWHKITYFLYEFKWLQVRIEHQCMTKNHILIRTKYI